MTIPASLLEKLADSTDRLQRMLDPQKIQAVPEIGNGIMDEQEFRYRLLRDVCGTEKLTEGLNVFISETEKLEHAIREKVRAFAKTY